MINGMQRPTIKVRAKRPTLKRRKRPILFPEDPLEIPAFLRVEQTPEELEAFKKRSRHWAEERLNPTLVMPKWNPAIQRPDGQKRSKKSSKQVAALKKLGYKGAARSQLSPKEADDIIRNKIPAPEKPKKVRKFASSAERKKVSGLREKQRQKVLKLVRKKDGATLEQIMKHVDVDKSLAQRLISGLRVLRNIRLEKDDDGIYRETDV